jgi:hypothetical protein
VQASLKPKGGQTSIVLRKEKERLREERDIRKIAKAAGVKIGGIPVSEVVQRQLVKISAMVGNEPGTEDTPCKQASSGWAKVGSSSMKLYIESPSEHFSQPPPPDSELYPPPPPSPPPPPPPPPAE